MQPLPSDAEDAPTSSAAKTGSDSGRSLARFCDRDDLEHVVTAQTVIKNNVGE